MSRNNSIIDRITIPTPCDADWDSMTGNDQVRFCEHCSLTIHDISTMTRRRAEQLVARSNGKLCLRYHRAPDGDIIMAGSSGRLHHLTRRASRIAAGAFTVALSLSSTVVAQQSARASSRASDSMVQKTPAKDAGGVTGRPRTVSGVVKDPDGAVVEDVKLSLSAAGSDSSIETTTNDTGEFILENVDAGVYKLRAKADGFKTTLVKDIEVVADRPARVEITLRVAVMATAGAMVMVMPSDLLVRAAMDNDLEGVKVLIDVGMDVNKVDDAVKETALFYATQNNNVEMIKALLAAGAEVNGHAITIGDAEGNRSMEFPALSAIGKGTTVEVVDILLKAGAKINQEDKYRTTPLMAAAQSEDRSILQRLIDLGAEINGADGQGSPALIAAVESGRVENARLLIDVGAKVNSRATEGQTALMVINSETESDMVKLLLDAKINVNLQDDAGETALQRAAMIDNVEVLELLIKGGAKLDVADNDGSTALMVAAGAGNLENVKALIAAGASINLRDSDGKTALSRAIEEDTDNSNTEILGLLIKAGAKLDVVDYDGSTALMLAASAGNIEQVKALIAAGASINLRDSDGKTALAQAIESDTDNSNKEVIKFLKRHGAVE